MSNQLKYFLSHYNIFFHSSSVGDGGDMKPPARSKVVTGDSRYKSKGPNLDNPNKRQFKQVPCQLFSPTSDFEPKEQTTHYPAAASNTPVSAFGNFTEEKNQEKAKSLEELQAEMDNLRAIILKRGGFGDGSGGDDFNHNTSADVHETTKIKIETKGELKTTGLTETEVNGVGDGNKKTEGISYEGDVWAAASNMNLGTLLAQSSPSRSQSANSMAMDVSSAITSKKDGRKVHLITFSKLSPKLWWFKAEMMNRISQIYFSSVVGQKQNEPPPSFWFNFCEVFIKSVMYSFTDTLARRKPGGSGNMPYPLLKLTTTASIAPGGFPLTTHLSNEQKLMKSMFRNAGIPAAIVLDTMKSSSPALYNGFITGSYRERPDKGTAYNNETDLHEQIKLDLQDAWKDGFGRITHNVHLDKYLTHHGIKTHLISLGYNSFEDVSDAERKHIYRDGKFPVWNEITEELVSG